VTIPYMCAVYLGRACPLHYVSFPFLQPPPRFSKKYLEGFIMLSLYVYINIQFFSFLHPTESFPPCPPGYLSSMYRFVRGEEKNNL
jgi:hypothetical protein